VNRKESDRLTDREIAQIRRLKAEGEMTQREIARLIGVSPATVSRVIRRVGRRFDGQPNRRWQR
jgi:IS30 family transposase